MAQTVVERSREWRFDQIAATDSGAVVALFDLHAVADVPIRTRLTNWSVGSDSHQSLEGVFYATVDSAPIRVNQEAERIHRAPNRVPQLVAFARRALGDAFGRRIEALAVAQPAYGGHRLRAESLQVAVDFLVAQLQAWRLPDEVLLPATGNVQGLWRSGPRRVVAQFLPEAVVWFTVMDNRELRLTGRVPVDEFAGQFAVQEVTRR